MTMSAAGATRTLRTVMPLISMPRIAPRPARPRRASAASFTPPALPRPPTSTCALMTTCRSSVARNPSAAARASAGVCATSQAGTGRPGRRGASWRRLPGSSRDGDGIAAGAQALSAAVAMEQFADSGLANTGERGHGGHAGRRGVGCSESSWSERDEAPEAGRRLLRRSGPRSSGPDRPRPRCVEPARLGDPLQRGRRLRRAQTIVSAKPKASSSSNRSARPGASVSVLRSSSPRCPGSCSRMPTVRRIDTGSRPARVERLVEPAHPFAEHVVDAPEPRRIPGVEPIGPSGGACARPSMPRASASVEQVAAAAWPARTGSSALRIRPSLRAAGVR